MLDVGLITTQERTRRANRPSVEAGRVDPRLLSIELFKKVVSAVKSNCSVTQSLFQDSRIGEERGG